MCFVLLVLWFVCWIGAKKGLRPRFLAAENAVYFSHGVFLGGGGALDFLRGFIGVVGSVVSLCKFG
jgi:hypothetical protein